MPILGCGDLQAWLKRVQGLGPPKPYPETLSASVTAEILVFQKTLDHDVLRLATRSGNQLRQQGVGVVCMRSRDPDCQASVLGCSPYSHREPCIQFGLST